MTVRRLAIMVALLLICFGTAFHRAYAAPTTNYAAQILSSFQHHSLLARIANRPAASPAIDPTFGHIESHKLYCVNGTPCSALDTPLQVSELREAQIELIYLNGVVSGRPDAVFLLCGRYYIDSAGNVHEVELADFVGNSAAQEMAGADPGTLNAAGSAPGNPTEATTRASSSMQVFSSNDTFLNTQGQASGYQITDNVADVALLGGASIYLSGQVYDFNSFGSGPGTPAGLGIMSCSINSSVPAFFGVETSEAVTQEDDGD